jgi:hypothetical protein
MIRRLVGLWLLAALPEQLAAQRWIMLDAGAGSSSHQLGPSGSVLSLSPRLLWLGRHGYIDAGAVYTRGTALGWNAALSANTAVQFPLSSRLTLDLGGEWDWTGHRHGKRTNELSLRPVLRFDRGDLRLSAGLALGRAALATASESPGPLPAADSTGSSPRPVDPRYSESRSFSRGVVEGTLRLGSFGLQGSITHTQFSQRALRAGAIWSPGAPGVDTLFKHYVNGYDDLRFGAGWSNPVFSVAGALEQRLGRREFRMRGWHLESSARVSGDLVLFAATGKTLSRLTVDLPARSYTTAGLRWTIGARRPAVAPAPPPDGTGTRVERVGTLVRLALHAPGAALVEVMGDFTEWEPVPLMLQAEGWWVLTRVLQPGIYHVNVRYDGGPWQAPADLPTRADEFGGTVGVLLVN